MMMDDRCIERKYVKMTLKQKHKWEGKLMQFKLLFRINTGKNVNLSIEIVSL